MVRKKRTGPGGSGVSSRASAPGSLQRHERIQQHGGGWHWVPKQGGPGGGQHQGRGGHNQGHGGPRTRHPGGKPPVYHPREYQEHGAPQPRGGGMPQPYYGGHRGGTVGRNVPPGPSRASPELHQAPYVQYQAPVVPPMGPGIRENDKNKKTKKEVLADNSPMNNRLTVTTNDGCASQKKDKEKKGFLASILFIMAILPPMCLAFSILSFGYPLTPKAQLSIGDPWMQAITGAHVILLVASIILACFASVLKRKGSIEGAGFHMFKWLLLLVWLFFNTSIWISLRFAASMSDYVVWPLYAVINIIILSVWCWYFYYEHPKILKACMELQKDSAGEDGPADCHIV